MSNIEAVQKFKLNNKDFEEINPDIKLSRYNALAFVSKIKKDQPLKVIIEFDGSPDSMMYLSEIAGEIGYYAAIEGTLAEFEQI